jgi:hypothetical protein
MMSMHKLRHAVFRCELLVRGPIGGQIRRSREALDTHDQLYISGTQRGYLELPFRGLELGLVAAELNFDSIVSTNGDHDIIT